MISMHFWGAAYGSGMLVAVLLIDGLTTGFAFADPEASFVQVMQESSLYIPGRVIAWLLILAGNLIFALHFLLMLLRIGQPGGDPTLFAPIGEEEKH
jgi:cytochrome c oxidase cbb3-type subunit 1